MSAEATKRTPATPGRATPRAAVRASQVSTAKMDYQLIGVVGTMVLLGLVMVFSASFPKVGTYFFLRQLLWIGLGAIGFIVMAAIPYHFWQRMAGPIIVLTVGGLLGVLLVGQMVFGATRHFFNGSFQPSEIAKLTLTIYVSAWVATRGKKLTRLEDGLLPFAVLMGLVAVLIAAERSFSVTIIVVVIGLSIYFVGGGRLKHISLILLIGTPILLIAMSQADYPYERVVGWYNVWFNPSEAPEDLVKLMWMLREGRGSIADPNMWNVKASVTGLWNDYLFANIGADLRFVGTFLVVGLYVWFGYRSLRIALNAPDRFGALTATGLTVWILVQATIHIGTSLTLIPTTGQPLPFMSYGGSALVSCLAAAGLLISISRAQPDKKVPYAHFALGWGDWRPRLPHSRRGGSARTDERGSVRRYQSQGRATRQRKATSSRSSRRTATAPSVRSQAKIGRSR